MKLRFYVLYGVIISEWVDLHAYCFPVLSKFCYNAFNPRGLFMSTPTTKKQSTMKNSVSKASILRAVASSSAIESNLSVDEIKSRLKAKNSRFSHLRLAL